MYIDRILTPIETLGPGKRLVIWTKGCSKHCKGCANPELWDTCNAKEYSAEKIAAILRNLYNDNPYDGITISGGDPLEQRPEILKLLEEVNAITEDILVYTGYTLDYLVENWSAGDIEVLKKYTAVLIDGPYLEELNFPDTALRGSQNQRVHIFKDRYKQLYDDYLSKGRKIQNVYMGSKIISVGIHNRKEEESL